MEDMNAREFWKLVPAVLVCSAVSFAYAKLPPPPPVDPAKAEEAKKKAADAAKKAAEALARAQDRVAERYKREKGGGTPSAKPPAPEMKKK
ncbi:MAG: hypothetical protein HY526_01055 [Betaproteobacteria bacterium]|nr:hypothetical protein [Betaproteobacteria bacterium]